MSADGTGLEQLLALTKRDQRKRSPAEAKHELTQAYIELTLAIGFARLGLRDRARELEQQALDVLSPLEDRLHATIVACYRFRLSEALELRPSIWDLPGSILALFAALKRESRYHLDRLLDHVHILEPNRVRDSDNYLEIWNSPGRPLRARSEKDPRALLRNARGDARALAAGLETIPDTELWRFVIAGARTTLADSRGEATFEAGLTELQTDVILPHRLMLARSIAAGASYCALEAGRAYLARVADTYRLTTDSYSQNSHFCISVLDLIDALVVAHTELELANFTVRASPVLATGFVF